MNICRELHIHEIFNCLHNYLTNDTLLIGSAEFHNLISTCKIIRGAEKEFLKDYDAVDKAKFKVDVFTDEDSKPDNVLPKIHINKN